MPANSAAFLTGPKVHPLGIRGAPYTSPSTNQVTIKVAAIAVNPVDGIKQSTGDMLYDWLKYPIILGVDVAGEVVEVGPEVTRYAIGDRVLGAALGISKARNDAAQGGFQHFVVLNVHMTSPIPVGISYEDATVIPLGLCTAACALFQSDQLALPLPSLNPKPTGKTVLIWGGSTSVGLNAIQLARAAGCEVITTCSPRNFALVKSLGASFAFDYNSPTVISDILISFQGRSLAGAISMGHNSANFCMDVLSKLPGGGGEKGGEKILAMVSYPGPKEPFERFVTMRTIWTFGSNMVALSVKAKLRGIKSSFIFGDSLDGNGVGEAVFQNYLPQALEQRAFIPAPSPEVVGKGLENIQPAIDRLMKGVSAKKLVVTL